MNSSDWLNTLVVGIIMLLCLRYVFNSTKQMFAEKKPGEGCGGCSSSGGGCMPVAKVGKEES
ncbi:MAG: FeoB-associated Cys-rich membrane protein [Magnetococcales bacterium]|nr:FeoB-associated Cys-rich membrane protein [Magnetococcales bacterium]